MPNDYKFRSQVALRGLILQFEGCELEQSTELVVKPHWLSLKGFDFLESLHLLTNPLLHPDGRDLVDLVLRSSLFELFFL